MNKTFRITCDVCDETIEVSQQSKLPKKCPHCGFSPYVTVSESPPSQTGSYNGDLIGG